MVSRATPPFHQMPNCFLCLEFHSHRRRAPYTEHSAMVRRFSRSLGRRHARRRHDERQREGSVCRLDRPHPRRRAFDADRAVDDHISCDRRRSRHLVHAVDDGDAVRGDERTPLRVRVPRAQLRDGGRAAWRTRRRKGWQEIATASRDRRLVRGTPSART